MKCLVVKVKFYFLRTILHRNLNVRSMNQGKLEMVKQKTARVDINILGMSELK